MTFSTMLVLGCLGLTPAQQPDGAAIAPTPSAAVPPAPTAPTAPTPTEAPVPPPAPSQPGATKAAPTFTFTLLGKSECIMPGTHGDAKAEDGKAEVTTEANQLKAVLTGAAGANVFFGVQSTASLSVQVVQEFEVTCSDASVNQVVLSLESNLLGFIRAKHNATACVQLASATLSPVGWSSTPYVVSYPTACVGGSGGCCSGPWGYKYETPQPALPLPPMPLGRYVLQANFHIIATAGGLLDAHSTAIFVPESEGLDAWEREHDPFKGDEHDDFGFTVTVKADSPPGVAPVTHKKPVKRLASRHRSTQPR